jgi:hypothetical protein
MPYIMERITLERRLEMIWRGWLTMNALVQAERALDKLSGGLVVTPVFELALSKPRSYGATLLHAIDEGRAICGAETPEYPDEACYEVSFWIHERDGVRKCKRCLKRLLKGIQSGPTYRNPNSPALHPISEDCPLCHQKQFDGAKAVGGDIADLELSQGVWIVAHKACIKESKGPRSY